MSQHDFEVRAAAAMMVEGLATFGVTAAALDPTRHILASTDDLRSWKGGLAVDASWRIVVHDKVCEARFDAAFQQAIQTGAAACALTGSSADRCLVANIRRVAIGDSEAPQEKPILLMTLTSVRELAAQPNPELLRQLFGLTRAEAKLASLVAAASPVTVAAEGCGVSVKTARTCLERIYGKLGVRRQAELAQRLSVAALPDQAKPSHKPRGESPEPLRVLRSGSGEALQGLLR